MQIITNNEKHNHMGKMVQMSAQANMMIIVSAFISGNLGKMFDSMPTIKQVTIYTNLSGYDDGADKIIALFDFCNYCKKKGIDLLWLAGITIFTECRCRISLPMYAAILIAPIWQNRE